MKHFSLSEFLFPPKCIICGELLCTDSIFCESCEKVFDTLCEKICPICKCKRHFCECICQDGVIDAHSHLCEYNDFSKHIVLYLKETKNKRVINFLSRRICDMIKKRYHSLDEFVIAYIPRSRKNIRIYGFDHSKALANQISKELCLPLVSPFERKGAKDQKSLDAKQREENARLSFSLSKDSHKINGKRIIIIDDTATTASTLVACANLAKNANAKEIYTVTITKNDFQK